MSEWGDLNKKCYKMPLNKWEGFVVDKNGYLLVQNERVILLSEVKQLIKNETIKAKLEDYDGK